MARWAEDPTLHPSSREMSKLQRQALRARYDLLQLLMCYGIVAGFFLYSASGP
jgi:hypothetical protein